MHAVRAVIHEAVEHRLRPGRSDLKHRASAGSATARGCPIESCLLPNDQARVIRITAIGSTLKAVEHRFGSGWSNLEHRAEAVGAAIVGGAVEVARLIENQTCVGIVP